MLTLKPERLQAVVQAAFDNAEGSKRWQTAITKAKIQLEENPYIHDDGDAVLILSPSNAIYEANGSCQCRAYHQGQPCWHRALARIVQRYKETVSH